VDSARKPIVGDSGHDDFLAAVLESHIDFVAMRVAELTLRPLNVDGLTVDRNLDTVKDRDRLLSDS
jgi:hypothetical protein